MTDRFIAFVASWSKSSGELAEHFDRFVASNRPELERRFAELEAMRPAIAAPIPATKAARPGKPKAQPGRVIEKPFQMEELASIHERHLETIASSMDRAATKAGADVQREMEKALELADWVRYYATLYRQPDYLAFADRLDKRAAAPKSLRWLSPGGRAVAATSLKKYVQAIRAPGIDEADESLTAAQEATCRYARERREELVRARSAQEPELQWLCNLIESSLEYIARAQKERSEGVLPPPIDLGLPSYVLSPANDYGSEVYKLRASSRPYAYSFYQYRGGSGADQIGVIIRERDGTWAFVPEGGYQSSKEGFATARDAAWGLLRARFQPGYADHLERLIRLPDRLPRAEELAHRLEAFLPFIQEPADRREAERLLQLYRTGPVGYDTERLDASERADLSYFERKAREGGWVGPGAEGSES